MYTEKEITEAIQKFYTMLADLDTPEEIQAALVDLDYETIARALRGRAGTVYACEMHGNYEKAFTYCGAELFDQRASLLIHSTDMCQYDLVNTEHCVEVWLLEDMSLAVTAGVCLTIYAEPDFYEVNYRVAKGSFDDTNHFGIDPEDLLDEFNQMCVPHFEGEAPYFELC